MKVKSKISYLGERNSILPGQMAEQLAVEVNVKNVTQYGTRSPCKKDLNTIFIIYEEKAFQKWFGGLG